MHRQNGAYIDLLVVIAWKRHIFCYVNLETISCHGLYPGATELLVVEQEQRRFIGGTVSPLFCLYLIQSDR